MYIRLPVWKFVVIELSRAMKGANDVEKDQFENFTRAGREFEKGRGDLSKHKSYTYKLLLISFQEVEDNH